MTQQSQQEPVYLITQAGVRALVDYLLAVPTGTQPGARLVRLMSLLDQLPEIPPTVRDILESRAAADKAP